MRIGRARREATGACTAPSSSGIDAPRWTVRNCAAGETCPRRGPTTSQLQRGGHRMRPRRGRRAQNDASHQPLADGRYWNHPTPGMRRGVDAGQRARSQAPAVAELPSVARRRPVTSVEHRRKLHPLIGETGSAAFRHVDLLRLFHQLDLHLDETRDIEDPLIRIRPRSCARLAGALKSAAATTAISPASTCRRCRRREHRASTGVQWTARC